MPKSVLKKFEAAPSPHLVPFDGSFRVALELFDTRQGVLEPSPAIEALFGCARRRAAEKMSEHYVDVARSIERTAQMIVCRAVVAADLLAVFARVDVDRARLECLRVFVRTADREVTDGEGAAVVYEAIGKDTLQDSLDSLRLMGVCAAYGHVSGPPDPVDIIQDLGRRGSLFITRFQKTGCGGEKIQPRGSGSAQARSGPRSQAQGVAPQRGQPAA